MRSANRSKRCSAYLDEWVYGVKDRSEYWQKLGVDAHQRLEVAPRPSIVVNYGQY